MRWGKTAVLATASAVGAGAVAAVLAGRAVSDLSVRQRGGDPAAADGLRVHATAAGRVALTRTEDTQRPGRYGLEWPDPGDGVDPGLTGHAVVGDLLETTAQTSVRRLERVDRGELAIGARATLTPRVHTGTPDSAFGLEYSDTAVRGELGPMPAWYVPGLREPWVIAVHGLGADREQVLPVLPVFSRISVPVLAITYRNDPGAPRSPDGLGHFGSTEWRDVEAAIRLAVDSGATRIVLYGWSLGAAMVLQAAAESSWKDLVRGVVLDSAVLDWRATAQAVSRRRGVPGPLAELGVLAAEGRAGVDQRVFDRLGEGVNAPILALHSPDDPIAPIAPVRRLVGRHHDQAVLNEFPHGAHAALWNVDQDGYETALSRFFTPLV